MKFSDSDKVLTTDSDNHRNCIISENICEKSELKRRISDVFFVSCMDEPEPLKIDVLSKNNSEFQDTPS